MGDHFTETTLLRAAWATEQVTDFSFQMKP
jgi:hypothetical protein